MWKGPQERGVTSRWGLRKKTDSENPAEIAFIAGSRSGMGELFWREPWEWGLRGSNRGVYSGSRGWWSLLSRKEIWGGDSATQAWEGWTKADVEGGLFLSWPFVMEDPEVGVCCGVR